MHYFTYSIYPHAGSVDTSDVVKEGFSLNYPLYCKTVEPGNGTQAAEYSMVSCDKSNVIIETIKKAEDSDEMIVRMYETWNKKVNTVLTFAAPIKSITECDLMEQNDAPLTADGNTVALTFKPFEIKTVKVRF